MSPAEMPPDGKVPAKKAPAKKAPAKKAPGKKKAPTKRPPAKKKAPAKKVPAKRAPTARKAPTDQHAAPSDDALLHRADVEMKPGPVVHEIPGADPAPPKGDPWDDDWGDIGWDEDDIDEDDRCSDAPSGEPASGPASEGAERFQAAARELIDAARTMLDAAEEAVADPHVFHTALGSLRGLADDVFRVASQANPMGHRARRDEPDDPDEFHHIRVD